MMVIWMLLPHGLADNGDGNTQEEVCGVGMMVIGNGDGNANAKYIQYGRPS